MDHKEGVFFNLFPAYCQDSQKKLAKVLIYFYPCLHNAALNDADIQFICQVNFPFIKWPPLEYGVELGDEINDG